MYNIAYIKTIKSIKFLFKNNYYLFIFWIYLLKSYIFNSKYTSSNAKLLFYTY